ncbi:MAG: glutamate formimidoyltransferase [Cytophagales bacterium]
MSKIIECVPNFSEGQNSAIIQSIAHAISKAKEVKLLDIDAGFHANRTVFTFAGEPNGVIEAAFQAIKTASQLIDMREHNGTHPRIGACDVCPLIPISGVSMEETIEYSKKLGQRVANELDIPVFLYENASSTTERKNLAWLRSGEYENLENKLKKDNFKPDFGEPKFNARSGIAIIGARPFLIAYNVNLATKDVSAAKEIASLIREKSATGLPKVKAIGWYIDEFDKVQVSTNITDFNITPVHEVFEKVKECASELDTQVTGSELVGMIPLKAIVDCGEYYLRSNKMANIFTNDELIEFGAKYLNLNEVKPFEAAKKVIELALNL